MPQCAENAESIEEIHRFVEKYDGVARSKSCVQAYLQRAMSYISKCDETPYRESLLALCSFVAERDR